MEVRTELLEASDAQIEDAIEHADPMILRGWLHQLTGDESLTTLELGTVRYGWFDVTHLANPAEIAIIFLNFDLLSTNVEVPSPTAE